MPQTLIYVNDDSVLNYPTQWYLSPSIKLL